MAMMAGYKVAMIIAGLVIAWYSRVIIIPEFQERVTLGYAI